MDNIYRETLRRSTLSAVYTFGGLSLLLLPTGWYGFAGYGILGMLLSPVVGLLHGLLMCPILSLPHGSDEEEITGRNMGYYILCIIAGGVAYASGVIVIMAVDNILVASHTVSDNPMADFWGEVSHNPFFWIALFIGDIAGARLGKRIGQETDK